MFFGGNFSNQDIRYIQTSFKKQHKMNPGMCDEPQLYAFLQERKNA